MSLTDDMINKRLVRGWYWVKTEHGFIQPMYYLAARINGEFIKAFTEEPEDRVVEVLDVCSFEVLQQLKCKLKKSQRRNKRYSNSIKRLGDMNSYLSKWRGIHLGLLKECSPEVNMRQININKDYAVHGGEEYKRKSEYLRRLLNRIDIAISKDEDNENS